MDKSDANQPATWLLAKGHAHAIQVGGRLSHQLSWCNLPHCHCLLGRPCTGSRHAASCRPCLPCNQTWPRSQIDQPRNVWESLSHVWAWCQCHALPGELVPLVISDDDVVAALAVYLITGKPAANNQLAIFKVAVVRWPPLVIFCCVMPVNTPLNQLSRQCAHRKVISKLPSTDKIADSLGSSPLQVK